MRRGVWRVAHPAGPPILSMGGRGGPSKPAQPGTNPAPLPLPNPIDAVTGPLTNAANAVARDTVAAGAVLLGVVLVLVGLLLASGWAGPVARGAGRAGLFAATRGAPR